MYTMTINKGTLEKTISSPFHRETEKWLEFSIGSGLKNTGDFLLEEDTSNLRATMKIFIIYNFLVLKYPYNKDYFILQCSRAELYYKVATSYVWLFDKLT